jgi:cobyrinic acid a,c-diamide synthase
MLRLPRVAVGTLQLDTPSQPMCWAMMEAFARCGRQLQHFLSRSCFCPRNGALAITGVSSRHLDTWLMSRGTCRELLAHGCTGRDLAVVEGHFASPDAMPVKGSSLDTLCDWLDLPRLVVLDVARLGDCRLPERPPQIDGLLLDRVPSLSEAFRLQTSLESLWEVPVLGALGELPGLRAAISRLSCGATPPIELCRELGNEFSRLGRLDLIDSLAARRDVPPPPVEIFARRDRRSRHSRVTVAVAYDPAFNCYFPDTLDLLELEGANVVDFSPLRDEILPEADVVYLGCGHPELYAEALSGNHCMLLALRNHVRSGGRVYAEGGGLAYLCQRLETPGGAMVPMVGALPAIARLNRQMAAPTPIEARLRRDSWLARAGTRLRGYLNGHWVLEPVGPMVSHLAGPGHELDLVGQYQVIGSRLHLNFAAQTEFLKGFLSPRELTLAHSPM